MSSGPVFISHATRDDAFVRDLRLALERQGIPDWVDSRNLRGGDHRARNCRTGGRSCTTPPWRPGQRRRPYTPGSMPQWGRSAAFRC
jgi:hypothetical protein